LEAFTAMRNNGVTLSSIGFSQLEDKIFGNR